jgi:hypothetical protein
LVDVADVAMDKADPDVIELVDRYERWRRIYRYAEKMPPNEPDWENGRLWFRYGYPYPDWTAYILQATADGGYRVFRATTERRETPAESPRGGTFARLQDAGKYIIFNVGEKLRIECRMKPINLEWADAGLDPRVDKLIIDENWAKYVLRSNPASYFTTVSRGIAPYNHILPLSYDQLDDVVLDGFPESIISQLASDSS